MNWALIVTGNLIEMFIIYNYWFSLLEMRYSKRKSQVIFFSVQLINIIRSWMMFNMVSLKAIITTIAYLILMQILFKDRWYKKLAIHTIYLVCVLIAESLSVVLAKYVYHFDMVNLTEASLPCFLWQGTACLFIFVFNIIALLILKNKKLNLENRVTQYIFLYASVQCFMVFVFTMFVFEYKVTSTVMILIIFFAMIASFLIGVLIYRTVRTATKKELEAEYIKKESQIKDKHFNELKDQYVEYRRLRHDFSNHLRIIKELKDPEKLTEYTSEIETRFNKMEQKSYCDNLTLDALLALKRTEANKYEIKTTYEICDIGKISISDFDLCTVISNLLDNAIEAAAKTDNKYIYLQINKKIDRMIITVKNSSPPVDMNLKTTKSDSKNHGIGINTVRTIAEKYDGDCVFKYDNAEFMGIVNLGI